MQRVAACRSGITLLVDAVGAVPVDLCFMCMKVERLLCPNREKQDLEINTMFST